MFKIDTNINQLRGDIFDTINSLMLLDKIHLQSKKYWPKIRTRLKNMLIDNLDKMHDVPVKDETYEIKTAEMQAGETLLRRLGEAEYPVISLMPWKRTGVLKEYVARDITAAMGESVAVASQDGEGIEYSIGPVVENFVPIPTNDTTANIPGTEGEPYPIWVEQELLKRSGGEIGVVFITDNQADELIEMLIKENINLVDTMFGTDTAKTR